MDKSPCCNAPFVAFRSFNMKMCADCREEYDWYLKQGQKPLITSSRDKSNYEGKRDDAV